MAKGHILYLQFLAKKQLLKAKFARSIFMAYYVNYFILRYLSEWFSIKIRLSQILIFDSSTLYDNKKVLSKWFLLGKHLHSLFVNLKNFRELKALKGAKNRLKWLAACLIAIFLLFPWVFHVICISIYRRYWNISGLIINEAGNYLNIRVVIKNKYPITHRS